MGENKHNKEDLKQMQSLPLDVKIRMTKRRIEEWHDHWNENGGGTYVSFSGGKDSTVLKHIIDSMYDDVPSVFVDTGLEYPEIKAFVRDINEGKYEPRLKANVEILRPKMRFDEVISKYGYPVISKENALYIRQCQNPTPNNQTSIRLRMEGIRSDGVKVQKGEIPNKWKYLVNAPFAISEQCCDVMKKRPIHKYTKESNRMPYIGQLAEESRSRERIWVKFGCNAFDNKRAPQSNPLSFWTEQDILHYITYYDLPIAKVYGDVIKNDKDVYETTGVDRTGCMFCMFGAHLEKEPNRFQRMKETHPKQYEYCMKDIEDGGLGLRKVLEFIGVPYE